MILLLPYWLALPLYFWWNAMVYARDLVEVRKFHEVPVAGNRKDWSFLLSVTSPFAFFQFIMISLYLARISFLRKTNANYMAAISLISLFSYSAPLLAMYLIIVVINFTMFPKTIAEIRNLREQYPLESLIERVDFPSKPYEPLTRSEDRSKNLEILEQRLDDANANQRMEVLRRVHEMTVLEFIGKQGFGIGRFIVGGTLSFKFKSPERIPIILAKGAVPFREGESHVSRRLYEIESVPLSDIHLDGVANFSFPEGFGYFKDLENVAGFESHRFHRPLKTASPWKIVHVDLVGLLVHESPVVYQPVDSLPRMDEVKSMPTRPLDSFESESLQKIKNGEDLVVADVPDGLRLLGAIRNAEQCVKCHGGKRGDLLGAFAYSIAKIRNTQ